MPMVDAHRHLLIDVRNGEYSLDRVLAEVAEWEKRMLQATEDSRLPAEIDYNAINAWLPGFYQRFWLSR